MKIFKSVVAIGLVALLSVGGLQWSSLSAKASEQTSNVPQSVPVTVEWSQKAPGNLVLQLDTSVMGQGTVSGGNVSGGDAGNTVNYIIPTDVTFGLEVYEKATGDRVYYGTWSTDFDENNTVILTTFRDIHESGTYVARARVHSYDSSEYLPSEWSAPVEFTYVRPEEELAIPQGLQWVAGTPGKVTHNSVPGASGYTVELYRDGVNIGASMYIGDVENPTTDSGTGKVYSYDFARSMTEKGTYGVKVRALSPNINEVANSQISGDLVVFDVTASANDITDKVENALDSLKEVDVTNTDSLETHKGTINTAVDSIQENTARELQIAMQVNPTLVEKIAQLETLYAAANNITVENKVDAAVEALVDVSKVAIKGAALNAAPGQSISLNIGKPAKEVAVDNAKYKNAVQIEMKLEGLADSGAALKVPVEVTIPIPAGIDSDKLVILHYYNDGTREIIRPVINNDNTCTFLLTGFSVFAFAEEDATVVEVPEDNTNNNTNRASGSYTMTAQEKSRFAMKYSLPVKYEVPINAGYQVEVRSEMQGQLFIDAVQTALDDYQLAYTFNIFTDQMTRAELENAIQIKLNVPKELQQEGRTFEIIGVNALGEAIVLADEDNDPNTVTFTVKDFYAFALCYKD